MFRKIMVPVDLAHAKALERAIGVATTLAGQWNAPITFVGATSPEPGPLGHNPQEYAAKLDAFAADIAARDGVTADAHALTLNDPTADLDKALVKAISETGADLVVMASHVPGLAEYVWPSHGGAVARHATASVFVVRPA
ncbi:universal stress protein [Palleronia caenipelagi]|uniref:Universal stress protein n=1 Tax=Palleronia caenipelagi TaxID=2489174 RepID=A0A547QB71_9RHOB|nr:universal stress protein [Palleronia caenipelagi]TRD23615.1 universal stress protein [Palleronia caenipelagi]